MFNEVKKLFNEVKKLSNEVVIGSGLVLIVLILLEVVRKRGAEAMETRMDAKAAAMETRMDAKAEALENRMNTRTIVMFVITTVISVISLLMKSS